MKPLLSLLACVSKQGTELPEGEDAKEMVNGGVPIGARVDKWGENPDSMNEKYGGGLDVANGKIDSTNLT